MGQSIDTKPMLIRPDGYVRWTDPPDAQGSAGLRLRRASTAQQRTDLGAFNPAGLFRLKVALAELMVTDWRVRFLSSLVPSAPA